MNISLIIPAHNEEKNLQLIIPAIIERIGDHILEIIIINDNSCDLTGKIAENLRDSYQEITFKIIHRKPPAGVGYALRDGFKIISESTEWVLMMDCDFLHNIDDLQKIIDKSTEGYDGVIGSRFLNSTRLIKYPFFKKILNRSYHYIIWIILGIQHKDLTNNFKLYSREVISNIKWESNDFSINAETGILPLVYGFKIAEVPVYWVQRDFGVSNFTSFDALRYGKGYLKVLLKAIRLKYGIVTI